MLLIFPIILSVVIIRFQKNAVRVVIDSPKAQLRYYRRKKLADTVDLNRFAVVEKEKNTLIVLPDIADYAAGRAEARELDCKGMESFDFMAADAKESSQGQSIRSSITDYLRGYLDLAQKSSLTVGALVSFVEGRTNSEVFRWVDENALDMDYERNKKLHAYQEDATRALRDYVPQKNLDGYNGKVTIAANIVACYVSNKHDAASLLDFFEYKIPDSILRGVAVEIPQEAVTAFCVHFDKGCKYIADGIVAEIDRRGGGRELAALAALRKYYAGGRDVRCLTEYVLQHAFAGTGEHRLFQEVKKFTQRMGVKPL